MDDSEVRQMLSEHYRFESVAGSDYGLLDTPYGRVRVYFKSDLIGFQLLDYVAGPGNQTWYGFRRWKLNFHRGPNDTLEKVREHVDQLYTDQGKGFPAPSELKSPPCSLRYVLRLNMKQAKEDMSYFSPYRTTEIPHGFCIWLGHSDGVQGNLPEWFKEIDKVAKANRCIGVSFTHGIAIDPRFPVFD